MKKKSLLLIIILMISTAFAINTSLALAQDMTADDFKSEALENITTISVSDAKALLDKGDVIFLDVRTKSEYRSGHIPGAVNISRGLLEFMVGKDLPDKNATIVVYCKTGGRSCLATNTLVKMGYKNVKNMDGGWSAWIKAGYPVE
ncbi:MAG: rhodanese-like domain-containing protein [Thermodesulfobacteriota bacterium]